VSVKFYLNRLGFAVVIVKCLGGSLFWTQCTFVIIIVIIIILIIT